MIPLLGEISLGALITWSRRAVATNLQQVRIRGWSDDCNHRVQ